MVKKIKTSKFVIPQVTKKKKVTTTETHIYCDNCKKDITKNTDIVKTHNAPYEWISVIEWKGKTFDCDGDYCDIRCLINHIVRTFEDCNIQHHHCFAPGCTHQI